MTILVAGAGPAGARLAESLAKQGLKVILVERISSPSQNAFSSAVLPINAVKEHLIPIESVSSYWSSWQILGPDGKHHEWQANNDLGVVLDFAILRRKLWENAKKAGVEFLLGCHVEAFKTLNNNNVDVYLKDSNGQRFIRRAELVVDATGHSRALIGEPGRYSFIGNDHFLKGLGIEWILQGDKTLDEKWGKKITFIFGSDLVKYGYGWIFPMANSRLKVGVCSLPPTNQQPSSLNNSLKMLMRKQNLDKLNVLDKHGGVISSTIKRSESHIRGRIIGVGDSVSTANLLGGEGIRHALSSSEVLAPLIIKSYFEAKPKIGYQMDALMRYKPLLKKRLGWRWNLSGKIAKRTWSELSGINGDSRIARLIDELSSQVSAEDLSALLFDYRFERYGLRLLPYVFGWR